MKFSIIDIRLAGRMLVKHPALTAIATIAVAFAIAVGTVGFEIARQALWPTIPLPDGNAIVAVQNWNAAASSAVRASRRDFELWQDGLTTISDLAAVVIEDRNVAFGTAPGQPTPVANVSASKFALTRVGAMMGRTLLDSDERGDAGEVAVVGYDFWQNQLLGAPDVVGRELRISGTPVTIVGVMPEGYAFPQRNGVWRPLRREHLAEARPSLTYVFGRLAPGRTRDEASAELAAIGARAATMFPETNKDLRVQVHSLPEAVSELPEAAALGLASINLFLIVVLALLCGNVAMLLFARAAARESELVVRAALGASRGRLIMQFFTEALLLCAVGTLVGLGVARIVLARTWTMIEEQLGALPFYIDTSLSATTIAYAVALMLIAAAIAGFIPALKVTSGGVAGKLKAASSGGGGLQFGGVWTAVIVAQIALMTMLPVPLFGVRGEISRETPPGFAAESFLSATLAVDRLGGSASTGDTVPGARAARLEAGYNALAERLRREPDVVDVTYGEQLPMMRYAWRSLELDPGPAAERSARCVRGYCGAFVAVDPRFFEVVGAPMVSGRALTAAESEHDGRAVVVNEFFVHEAMGGRDPIGRQIRLSYPEAHEADAWYHIVGVVPNLGVNSNGGDFGRSRVFRAALPRNVGPLRMAIQLRGDPQLFAVRLRELAQDVDPALRVIDPKPLPQLKESVSTFWVGLLGTFMGVTLMLSLAGVYAVTAFAVARRTREIGVRVALGAGPWDVLRVVFRRPMIQVAMGIGVGAVLATAIANNDLSDVHLDDLVRSAKYALVTVVCCVVACVVPTRRALGVQPTEALRQEG